MELPLHWASRAVNNVNVPGEVSVTAITRQGKTFIPTLGTVFQEGDRVAIAILATSRGRLEDLMALR